MPLPRGKFVDETGYHQQKTVEQIHLVQQYCPTQLDTFKNELRAVFSLYLKTATGILQRPESSNDRVVSNTRLGHGDPGWRLRSLAREAEDSSPYHQLYIALYRALTSRDPAKDSSLRRPYRTRFNESLGTLESKLFHFFRRSHFYLDIYSGKSVSHDDLLEQFSSSLFSRRVKTTSCKLMRGVSFSSECINIEDLFEIRNFSVSQLDALVDGENNGVFYPSVKLETELVSLYSFIVEEQGVERAVFARPDERTEWPPAVLDEPIEQRSDKPTDVRGLIEGKVPDMAILLLALFRWEDLDRSPVEYYEWSRFTLPFSFQTHDDVFSRPLEIPIPPKLGTYFPHDAGWVHNDYLRIDVDPQQEYELTQVVEKARRILKILPEVKGRWDFIDIAIGYLAKAFLTDEHLDQILWHVATLEALLGEKSNDGIMEVLRRRISNIIGTTREEKQEIGRKFNQLSISGVRLYTEIITVERQRAAI